MFPTEVMNSIQSHCRVFSLFNYSSSISKDGSKANDQFHILTDKIKEAEGSINSEKVLFEFKEWLRREFKKFKEEE